jgi:hypothetical protein
LDEPIIEVQHSIGSVRHRNGEFWDIPDDAI